MDLIISKGPSIIECELLKILKLKNRTINGPYNSRKLKKGYKINVGPYTKVYPPKYSSASYPLAKSVAF